MGCCPSQSTGTRSKEARNDNPPIQHIDVQDIDPRYPAPTPPPNIKDDIYRASDYSHFDNRVAQEQLSGPKLNTYDTLIKALTAGCTTELQKLRAIFVWLYLQDIYGSYYSGVTDPHTPRGYMKLIKTGNGSYESFFALLCRAANIPCNVIRGIAKGDKYEVGQYDMIRLGSAWNAVYVAGGWRLIHPLWAYFQEKQLYENGVPPPPGTKWSSIHEFFYLTDPNRMICFCKPHADPWQLLKTKWEHKKFLRSPMFTEDYFPCGLMLPKKYNAIIYCDNGVSVIEFDHEGHLEPALDAHVVFNQGMSSDEMPANINMKDYVIKASSTTRKTLVIRFPVRGRYIADVFGGTNRRMPKIVEFRLECEDLGWNPQPFPLNPSNGFGILDIASQFGLSDPVPDYGIVLVRATQQKHFSFTATQRLEVQTTLFHNSIDSNKFTDFISSKYMDGQVHVSVTVPDENHMEFGLQIAVRPEHSSRNFTVVANYLLVDENWRKKTAVVAPSSKISRSEQDRIRKALIAATHKNDIDKLEEAIDEFEKARLSDNGDLTRARRRLLELHLQNLRKTTLERNLEELEKSIKSAKKSHVLEDLQESKELADAEAARLQLRRLKLYMHKVLALNKPTISEIHSYQRPRPLVHNVMKATFRILGEPKSKIQDWSYIQTSMRALGKNSMLNRIKRCDVVHLKQMQVSDAETYLGETNKHLVRMCSAGAGTFYVWSNNMISEYQGKPDQEPLNIWNSSGQWEKSSPRQKKKNPNDNSAFTQDSMAKGKHRGGSAGDVSSLEDWNPNTSRTARSNNSYASGRNKWNPNDTSTSRKNRDWNRNEEHENRFDGRRSSNDWDPNVPAGTDKRP